MLFCFVLFWRCIFVLQMLYFYHTTSIKKYLFVQCFVSECNLWCDSLNFSQYFFFFFFPEKNRITFVFIKKRNRCRFYIYMYICVHIYVIIPSMNRNMIFHTTLLFLLQEESFTQAKTLSGPLFTDRKRLNLLLLHRLLLHIKSTELFSSRKPFETGQWDNKLLSIILVVPSSPCW